MITGCTDGIGREYARQLAAQGCPIVHVGRNKTKLEAVQEELESKYLVESKTIVVDLSEGFDVYSHVSSQLDGVEIGILVNNAGVMYEQPSRFCDVPPKFLSDHITINVQSLMLITHMVLPQMVERKRGLVINVGSISSLYPLPSLTVYSASKVFVDWFSQGLDQEYRSQGIEVQSLIPSYISTRLVKFSDFLSEPSWLVPNAETFVRSALGTVGYSRRTTGFWSHGLQYWIVENIPQWMWTHCSQVMFKLIDSSPERKF